MKALIIYQSLYGNTKQVADAIAAALGGDGEITVASIEEVGDPSQLHLEGVDLVLVGGPTHRHTVSPTLKVWLQGLPRGSLKGMQVAAFDTHYRHWLSGSASRAIARKLRRKGGRQVAPPEGFLVVRGREGPLEEHEIEHARSWATTLAQRSRAPAAHL